MLRLDPSGFENLVGQSHCRQGLTLDHNDTSLSPMPAFLWCNRILVPDPQVHADIPHLCSADSLSHAPQALPPWPLPDICNHPHLTTPTHWILHSLLRYTHQLFCHQFALPIACLPDWLLDHLDTFFTSSLAVIKGQSKSVRIQQQENTFRPDSGSSFHNHSPAQVSTTDLVW